MPVRTSLIVTFLTLALDQFSKWVAIYVLDLPNQTRELTSFFNLVMVWNQGISFGMLNDGGDHGRTALMVMTFLIIATLFVWVWRNESRMTAWGLGLIIGGAIGNLVDRARFGAVADFLDFHWAGVHWPAFNVADSAIVIGVAILGWDSIFNDAKETS